MNALLGAHIDRMPLDIAVPVRRLDYDASRLDHRSAFILRHVDDVSSIDEIAKWVGLAVEEVLEVFLALVGAGAVALDGPRTAEQCCPPSGIYRRHIPE